MRLGVDLGGTKIEIVALDDDGRERVRQRVETPVGDYAATLDRIASLVEHAERSLGCSGASVGVGIPGSPSPVSGLVRNANSTWLNGRPLQADLQNLLAREVRIANDANCFALSEAIDGAGRGERVVFGVILGTGVGGGIVIDGTVLEGRNAIAGEWGHNPLPTLGAAGERPHGPNRAGAAGTPYETDAAGAPDDPDAAGAPDDPDAAGAPDDPDAAGAPDDPDAAGAPDSAGDEDGPRCWCGQRGCVETYLSGPALGRDHLRHTGRALQAPQIAAGAQAGEAACIATLERYERRLARALATVVNLLDPDVIVLGGGVSNIDRLYPNLERLLPESVFADRLDTRIVRALHGDSSGVRGAAWLWPAPAPRSISAPDP